MFSATYDHFANHCDTTLKDVSFSVALVFSVTAAHLAVTSEKHFTQLELLLILLNRIPCSSLIITYNLLTPESCFHNLSSSRTTTPDSWIAHSLMLERSGL